MANNKSIQFLRGSGGVRQGSGITLLPGQPFYDYTNHKLYVGGKTDTPLSSAIAVGNEVTSVNGRTGNVVISKSDVGLGNVDNVRQYSANNPPPSVWETGKSSRLNLYHGDKYTKDFDSSCRAILVTIIDNVSTGFQDTVGVKVTVGSYTFTRSFDSSVVNSFGFCVFTCPVFDDLPDDLPQAQVSKFSNNNYSSAFIIRRDESGNVRDAVLGVTTGVFSTDNNKKLTIKVEPYNVGNEQDAYIYVKYNALRVI